MLSLLPANVTYCAACGARVHKARKVLHTETGVCKNRQTLKRMHQQQYVPASAWCGVLRNAGVPVLRVGWWNQGANSLLAKGSTYTSKGFAPERAVHVARLLQGQKLVAGERAQLLQRMLADHTVQRAVEALVRLGQPVPRAWGR